MRKRYLPFGYQIEQGEIAIVSKESNAVRFMKAPKNGIKTWWDESLQAKFTTAM